MEIENIGSLVTIHWSLFTNHLLLRETEPPPLLRKLLEEERELDMLRLEVDEREVDTLRLLDDDREEELLRYELFDDEREELLRKLLLDDERDELLRKLLLDELPMLEREEIPLLLVTELPRPAEMPLDDEADELLEASEAGFV